MAEKKKTDLLPVYLIVGEDELKRRRVVERLRSRIAEFGNFEFNHDQFDGKKAAGSDIVSACVTLPFASELRLVEVSDCDKLAKSDMDELLAYLKAANSSSVLALSATKLAKNTRLYKSVTSFGSQAIIECVPLKRFELVKILPSMAQEHGCNLSRQAAEKLIDLVGSDTLALNSALQKLGSLHTDSSPLGPQDIEFLINRTQAAKPWELLDAFSARDVFRCVELLPYITVSPYALIGMCSTRLRELVCAKSLESRGESSRLASELKVPDWRVKNHLRWARGFSEAELHHAFSTARDCEKNMKSGTDAYAAFQDWLIATIA